METPLEAAVKKLSYEELKSLDRDLSMGTPLTKHLVEERIQTMEMASGSCAVCGGPLQDSPNSFTLVFGPSGLKKKSAFCAVDCLEYFVARIKSRGVMPPSASAK